MLMLLLSANGCLGTRSVSSHDLLPACVSSVLSRNRLSDVYLNMLWQAPIGLPQFRQKFPRGLNVSVHGISTRSGPANTCGPSSICSFA
jgi:hypothetical protein